MRISQFLVCLAVIGITARMHAQSPCGSLVFQPYKMYCCNQLIVITDSFTSYPNKDLLPKDVQCSSTCKSVYTSASSSLICLFASLNTPEMIKKLNEMSKRMPLLVASCEGGLVPYRPRPISDSADTDHVVKPLIISDVQGSGE